MSVRRTEIGKLSVKHEGFTIEWTIEDALFCTEGQKCFNSPSFTTPGTQWHLCIYPNGDRPECLGWISLFLYRVKDSTYPKRVDYSLGVKKADGAIEKVNGDVTHVFPNDGQEGNGYCKFFERSALLRRKSELLPSDSLTVTCNFRVDDSLEATSDLMKLSENLENLFISKTCSDATLKVKNKRFSVHKAVLESRSPVFESMFEVDMKERKTGVVDIVDCDPDVFHDFLTYLYSGKFQNSTKRDFDLYRIADKYAVEELKLECVRSMLTDLSTDNVFEVAHLAHQFGEEALKTKTQDFFNENFYEITRSAQWVSLMVEKTMLVDALLKNMAEWLKERM